MSHVNQILSCNNESTVTYLELAELRISTCMPIYVPMGSGDKTILRSWQAEEARYHIEVWGNLTDKQQNIFLMTGSVRSNFK